MKLKNATLKNVLSEALLVAKQLPPYSNYTQYFGVTQGNILIQTEQPCWLELSVSWDWDLEKVGIALTPLLQEYHMAVFLNSEIINQLQNHSENHLVYTYSYGNNGSPFHYLLHNSTPRQCDLNRKFQSLGLRLSATKTSPIALYVASDTAEFKI